MTIKQSEDFDAVSSFLRGSFSAPTHWPDWNRVISNCFGTEFVYWVVMEADAIIGVCPVHISGSGRTHVFHSGERNHGMPYGGWIFDRKYNLDIGSVPLSIGDTFSGFTLPLIKDFKVAYTSSQSRTFATLVVDLRKDEEAIWSGDINAKRRNMVRKAAKSGVYIEKEVPGDIGVFYDAYVRAYNRYGLSPLPCSYFEYLFGKTGNIECDVLWAKRDGEILSGTVVVRDKDYAIYWLGLNPSESVNLGQSDALQWEAIRRARIAGCKTYDLCSIEKERLPAIYAFKKGFSKTEISLLHLRHERMATKVLRRIKKVVDLPLSRE